MKYDADVQALVDDMAEIPPWHVLGVEGSRNVSDLMPSTDVYPSTPIHEVENFSIRGPGGDIALRLYRPSATVGVPVLLYIHGGGWTLGDLNEVDETCRQLSIRSDCMVISVDYRLAPEHKFPAAFEDCCAAAEWLALHAVEIGGNSSRMAIGGDSAGANLAAAVSLWARDNRGPAFSFQLLVYRPFAVPRESASAVRCVHAALWAALVSRIRAR